MTASFDFETYSAAGHEWDPAAQKWVLPFGVSKGTKKGLGVVQAAVYSEHPTTEVLTLSFDLKDGAGKERWKPGRPLPVRLFAYLAAGGAIEAHNAMFEWLIWVNVCIPKYGFPPFSPYQLRCSMATARVNSLPGRLADLSNVLSLPIPKDKDGTRLLDKFSVPRSPTKTDARLRIRPEDDPVDFERLEAYCDTDLDAEHGASVRMTPMSADELLFWWIDQEINYRGVAIDRPAVRDCLAVLAQVLAQYNEECRQITGGLDVTQLSKLQGWLAAFGVHMDSMDVEAIDASLARPAGSMPPHCRRVLELRRLTGSASVKKLYSMEHQACRDDRLRNLITHHGARTGRPTGEGPQPLNLPKAGPDLKWCADCSHPFKPSAPACPWCGSATAPFLKTYKWAARPKDLPKTAPEAVDCALQIIATRSLELVQLFFGDALLTISGCIRGLFVANPGKDLLASDYSSIEAVVLAQLAGEQWRIDAFRENKPIYLLGASKITGRSLEEYEAYYAAHGEHHPDRQKIGKISELACGFGGWVGSYIAFGSEEPEPVIKAQILGWRAASPAIPEFWGGQFRGLPWDPNRRQEFYGVEGAAVQAILYPGYVFDFRGLKFFVRTEPGGKPALIIRLLSGRELTYHQPQLTPSDRWPGQYRITYWTWNTNVKYGAKGWVLMETYGGRLTENIVQATAHDILRFAIINLRAAGYPTVLHVYDEIVGEIPQGTGSLEDFERIMNLMPPWAHDWPIRASGGWRGRRYRKG